MGGEMSKALIQVLFWAVSVISWLKFAFLVYLFNRLIVAFCIFFLVLLKNKNLKLTSHVLACNRAIKYLM